jgi:hypothetical protein
MTRTIIEVADLAPSEASAGTSPSIASPFVVREPLEVGNSQTHQFFGVALVRITPTFQVAFEEAATPIRSINVATSRPINRPR